MFEAIKSHSHSNRSEDDTGDEEEEEERAKEDDYTTSKDVTAGREEPHVDKEYNKDTALDGHISDEDEVNCCIEEVDAPLIEKRLDCYDIDSEVLVATVSKDGEEAGGSSKECEISNEVTEALRPEN